jgi:putative ABC transport system substrate-binding protein
MKTSFKTFYLFLVLTLISSFLLSACGVSSQKKIYKIGVVNLAAAFDPILIGFKAGMEKAGYVEGQNLTYIYDGPAASPDTLNAIFENLKSEKVDLVLTFGTLTTLRAKESLAGTDIPVIFGPVTDPVASGIVVEVLKPGGNITGIQTGNPTPKRLEWLLKIDPNIKRLYVFNNPNDNSSVQALAALTQAASTFNVELVTADASTPDEIAAALSRTPHDIDAIFILASAIFEAHIDKFVNVANVKKLPLAAPATANVWQGALTSFGHDNVPLGQQASQLAAQILRGANPADLPIESADLFVSINLKTAEIIGLDIPDNIIRQANIIVR